MENVDNPFKITNPNHRIIKLRDTGWAVRFTIHQQQVRFTFVKMGEEGWRYDYRGNVNYNSMPVELLDDLEDLADILIALQDLQEELNKKPLQDLLPATVADPQVVEDAIEGKVERKPKPPVMVPQMPRLQPPETKPSLFAYIFGR